MSLSTLPIGSLPPDLTGAELAAFQALWDVEGWPEFPARDGSFLEALERPEFLQAMRAWIRAPIPKPTRPRKIQFAGPATLARYRGLSFADATTRLRRALDTVLLPLSEIDSPLLVFLDEPECASIDAEYPEKIQALFSPYRTRPSLRFGIHSCANTPPWRLLAAADSPFDLLSFDWDRLTVPSVDSRDLDAIRGTKQTRVFGLAKARLETHRLPETTERLRVFGARTGDFLSPPCGLAGETASGALEVVQGLIRVKELWSATPSSPISNSGVS